MVIYIDVLLFVNFFIDFLLIRLCSIIIKRKISLKRHIISALVASLFSLYIFLPNLNIVFDLLIRLLSTVIVVFLSFGFSNLRFFIRSILSFLAVSFSFVGIIFGLEMIKDSARVLVNNGVVYFDVSPVFLIIISFLIYVIIAIYKKITTNTAKNAERCEVTLNFNNRTYNCYAITDSGHSLDDAFGDSLVIIVDRKVAEGLVEIGDLEFMVSMIPPENELLKKRFRLIPVKTVSGEKMLPAIRIDSIVINSKSEIKFPIAVISGTSLGDDFSAILPSEVIL